MPTKWIVSYSCDTYPCNNRTAVVKVVNVTSSAGGEDKKEEYDHVGAMRFIVATVLVYSLIGVLGMLLLRIKRSASKSQRTLAMQDDSLQRYLKNQDMLILQGRRDRMRKETERMNSKLAFSLSRLTSVDSTSSANTGHLSEDSSFLFASSPGLDTAGYDPTLDISPRSQLFLPLKFSFSENLPTLVEGLEEHQQVLQATVTIVDETRPDRVDETRHETRPDIVDDTRPDRIDETRPDRIDETRPDRIDETRPDRVDDSDQLEIVQNSVLEEDSGVSKEEQQRQKFETTDPISKDIAKVENDNKDNKVDNDT